MRSLLELLWSSPRACPNSCVVMSSRPLLFKVLLKDPAPMVIVHFSIVPFTLGRMEATPNAFCPELFTVWEKTTYIS